tara:strand:+ start:43 stop:690 length:648 start_codon:yes stop_codon:yes gene_type:complete
MAANEHSNLSNDNLHVPLDFSTASNDTVLTKDDSGSLVWQAKSGLKVSVLNIRGFMNPAGSTNYFFPSAMTDTKAAFEFAEDYGASSITAANDITGSKVMRSSCYVAPLDCTLNQISGWMTGDETETATLALIKCTPTADLSDSFEVDAGTNTITILDEISVSTYGNNSKMGVINETSFTIPSLSQGDLIIPLVKSAGGDNDLYFNISIELIYSS